VEAEWHPPPIQRIAGSRKPYLIVSPTSTKPSRQLYVVLFVILTLIISVACLWFYRAETEEVIHSNYEMIASVGEEKSDQLRQWRRARAMDVARDSGSPQLIEDMGKFAKEPGNTGVQEKVLTILGIILRGGEYARSAAISPNGKVISKTGEGPFTVNVAVLALAQKNPGGAVSDLFHDENGEVCLDAAASIRDLRGNLLGFVVLRARAADHLYPLIRHWPSTKRTMEFFLVQREGNKLVYLNDLLHEPGAALSLRVPLDRHEMHAVQAVLGHRGIFAGKDYRGREVLADLRAVPDSPWFAVTQVDMEDIMEEVHSRLLYTVTFTVVLVLLAATTIGWAYRFRQLLQARQLLDAERLQNQSDGQFRMLLDSLHEGFALHEIICDEAGTPVDYRFLWVNTAFERMTGKNSKDVVGQSVLDVYPETESIWIERYGKVTQTGEQAHFEEYSGTLDKYFRVTAFCPQAGQFAAVFEDISERKASEAKIARLNRLYLTLSQCNQAIVHAVNTEELLPNICRYTVELGGLKMAWVGMVDEEDGMIKPVVSFGSGSDYLQGIQISTDPESPLGRGPSGTAIRENKPVWCEDFLNDPNTIPWQERARTYNWKVSASIPLNNMGKVVGVLTIYGEEAGALDAEVRKLLLEMAEDISFALGHFTHEEALRESEERFRNIFQQIPSVAIQGYNEVGVTQFWNQYSEELYGYTAKEAIGRNLLELIVAPEMRENFKGAMSEMARTGQAIPPGELSLVHKDGSRVSVLSSFVQVKIQGRPTEFFCLDVDLTSRNKAESKLRESESRFRLLVENLPLALVYGNMERTTVFRNEYFTRLFGYTAADIPNMEMWWKLAYPDSQYRSEIMEKWDGKVRQAALGSREIHPFECRMKCKNGEMRTVEVGGLIFDGNLLTTFNDITERKRAEDALQESEFRFRTTFEQAAVGMAHVGLDGRWLRVNQKVCEIVGYSMEELLQNTFQEITHPDDLEADLALMRKCLSGELTTMRIIKRYIRKDGSIVPVCLTISVVPEKSGKPSYSIVVIEDISGRMKTEAQLRLRSAALEASANAMVITNAKGAIEWTNPAFSRFTGYTAEEALGKTPALLKSSKHEPAFYVNLWNTIKSGKVWSGEIVNRRKDGTEYTEEMTITAMRGEGGKVSHYIAVKQDITERKLMEEKMLRTQRMESLGTLAAGVAHDLNNILTPILLSADLLRKAEDPAMRESMLSNIEKSVKRGAGIISQVLTFARGTSGRRISLDVKRLVSDLEKIACETFPPGITITSFIPPGLGEVTGDPTQLHQVLLNLFINARDAMPAGGILFISAEQVRVDANFAAMVPDAKEGDFVMISVVDSGEGIPKSIVGKIFDPFFTTKEIGRGTGLGLSTVAGIVRSHGGFIVVESEPGRGSVFKIYLPASAVKDTKAKSGVNMELPMGCGQTILLVEDEANILAVTSTVLGNGGYKILQAAGGIEALEIYRKQPGEISLVLTDIMMPGMGGVELARAVREINPQARIVASTGQATEACEAELRSIGVRVILHKPYDARRLLAVVHEEICKEV